MQHTQIRQPLRLTRRGERVKNTLLLAAVAACLLLTGLVEEVPESNPPFGETGISQESEAK